MLRASSQTVSCVQLSLANALSRRIGPEVTRLGVLFIDEFSMTKTLLIAQLRHDYSTGGIFTPREVELMADEELLDKQMRCPLCGGTPYTAMELEGFIARSESYREFQSWAVTYSQATCVCSEVGEPAVRRVAKKI